MHNTLGSRSPASSASSMWRISSVRLSRLRSNSVPRQESDFEVTLDRDMLKAVTGETTDALAT